MNRNRTAQGGGWLAAERATLGLTTTRVAELARLSRDTIHRIETGRPVQETNVVRVALALIGYRAALVDDGPEPRLHELERRVDWLEQRLFGPPEPFPTLLPREPLAQVAS